MNTLTIPGNGAQSTVQSTKSYEDRLVELMTQYNQVYLNALGDNVLDRFNSDDAKQIAELKKYAYSEVIGLVDQPFAVHSIRLLLKSLPAEPIVESEDTKNVSGWRFSTSVNHDLYLSEFYVSAADRFLFNIVTTYFFMNDFSYKHSVDGVAHLITGTRRFNKETQLHDGILMLFMDKVIPGSDSRVVY